MTTATLPLDQRMAEQSKAFRAAVREASDAQVRDHMTRTALSVVLGALRSMVSPEAPEPTKERVAAMVAWALEDGARAAEDFAPVPEAVV